MADIKVLDPSSSVGVEENVIPPSISSKRKSKRSRPVVQMYNNEHEYSRSSMKKVKSKKKTRRFENCNYIYFKRNININIQR